MTGVESMGDWDRVTVCSERRASGGYTGNSFWLTRLSGGWYVGTWGGMLYRIPDENSVAELCIEWLSQEGHRAKADFDVEFKSRFGLVETPDEEFDAMTGCTTDR